MPKLKELDNPNDLHNPSSARADSLLNHEQKTGEDAGINAGIDQLESHANDSANATTKNIDNLSRKESGSGDIPNQYYNPSNDNPGDKSGGRRYLNFLGPISLKKKGPLALIIALLLLSAGGPLALLPLGPIMFVENVVRDVNDQVSAMDDRFLWMARNKVPKADREQALKGCGTVVTIRCKFATIGNRQIEKLKYAGITVEGNKSRIPGRTVPETYTFRGEKFTATEWGSLLNGKEVTRNGKVVFKKGSSMHTGAMRSQRIANNARYSSVSDKSFLNHVYKRFGISKKAPELSGKSKAERVNALLNKAGTGDIGSLNFISSTDEDGKTTYTLSGCTSNCTQYSEDQVRKMQKSIDALKTAKPPSKLKTLGIGALSVTGYWDLACTVSNTITAATIAAKMGNLAQSIEFVSPVLAAVHKIKSGQGTYEDGQTVGEFFGDADNRKAISDISALAEIEQENFDQENISSLGDVEIPEGENPNYGKNGLDSVLYQMSSNPGTVAPQTETRAQFSLGFGQSSLLAFAGKSSNFVQDVVNIGSNGAVCDTVQSWWMRGIGLIGGIAILATGVGTGPKIAQAAATTAIGVAVLYGLNAIINKALSNNLVEEADLENDKVARTELAWTGLSGMMQEGEKARGMLPSDAGEITAYQSSQNSTNVAYDDIERSQVTDQFDAMNEFSFMGTLSRSLFKSTSNTSSIFSSLGLINEALSDLSTSTFAAPINTERFKQCDDEAYKELGIDADVQCNIRYTMPQKDLKLDTDEVAKWMEEQPCGGGTPTCVNAETGLPDGYTPPDPALAQTGAMAVIQGVGDGFTPDGYVNDYAKFLQFCAYRTLPYGETGEDGDSAGKDWETGKKCRDTDSQWMSYFRIYTLDKTIQEAEDDEGLEDESGDAVPRGESTLRVATLNVSGDSTADQSKIDSTVSVLRKNKPDVVGFQEFNLPWRTAALDGSKTGINYKAYPEKPEYGGGGSPSVNSILYNADRFQVLDGGTMPNLEYFNNKALDAPYVLLKDSESQQEFYVLNTHDPAGSKDESLWELHKKSRFDNANEHVKFINSLKEDVPVIFVGDFNSGYSLRSEGGNQTYNNTSENLAYCILNKGTSLVDAYDVAEGRDFKCPNPGNENSVDHIYLSEGLQVSKYFRGWGGDVHSSHFADIVIGSSDVTWPVDKKLWIQNRSNFLEPHTGTGSDKLPTGTAWGDEDNMGTSSKGAGIASDLSFPSGTKVYAMVGGKVTSTSLCGSGDGIAIKSDIDGKTLGIAYMHGNNQQFKVGDTVNTGDYIMDVNKLGCNVTGPHLHLGIAYDGKYICPQDVFLALDKGTPISWSGLVGKAVAPCGR